MSKSHDDLGVTSRIRAMRGPPLDAGQMEAQLLPVDRHYITSQLLNALKLALRLLDESEFLPALSAEERTEMLVIINNTIAHAEAWDGKEGWK